MSDSIQELPIIRQSFAPTISERRRWRWLAPRSSGRRTLRILKQIEAERPLAAHGPELGVTSRTWLLRHRADLRWAIQHSYLEPIKLYLADCPREMFPLGVWLWGRCADRFRLYGLSAFCHDPSPQVRRQVAKALRRLEAWALLQDMAEANPEDARIQWYAKAPTTHRPFAERLKDYTSRVDDSRAGEVATPSRMQYWSLYDPWEGKPPKTMLYIRRMLRRIRHLVRWGVS